MVLRAHQLLRDFIYGIMGLAGFDQTEAFFIQINEQSVNLALKSHALAQAVDIFLHLDDMRWINSAAFWKVSAIA